MWRNTTSSRNFRHQTTSFFFNQPPLFCSFARRAVLQLAPRAYTSESTRGTRIYQIQKESNGSPGEAPAGPAISIRSRATLAAHALSPPPPSRASVFVFVDLDPLLALPAARPRPLRCRRLDRPRRPNPRRGLQARRALFDQAELALERALP